MFANERRNHSKTRVYGDLCVRVPVDTPIAADRLKKAKKSFKSERFDSFFHFCPTGSNTGSSALNRGRTRSGKRRDEACDKGNLCVVGPSEASWSQIGREASNMDRQPFESPRPIRGHRSRLKLYSDLFCITRRLREPVATASQSVPQLSKHIEIAGLFMSAPRPLSADTRLFPSIRSANALHLGIRSSHLSFEGAQVSGPMRAPNLLLPNAAQPLHYHRGEGWNDCSPTQEPAGRGNEEMTQ